MISTWKLQKCESMRQAMTSTPSCSETVTKFVPDICSKGHWVDSPIPSNKPERIENDLATQRELVCPSCPDLKTETRSCGLGRGGDHEKEIRRRRWQPEDNRCEAYFPSDFLRRFENKTIVFIGDSVMQQIWEELVTQLSAWTHTAEIYFKPPWQEEYSFTIASLYDASIVTLRHNYNKFDHVVMLRHVLKAHGFTDNDIFVFNIGIHYNEPNSYRLVCASSTMIDPMSNQFLSAPYNDINSETLNVF